MAKLEGTISVKDFDEVKDTVVSLVEIIKELLDDHGRHPAEVIMIEERYNQIRALVYDDMSLLSRPLDPADPVSPDPPESPSMHVRVHTVSDIISQLNTGAERMSSTNPNKILLLNAAYVIRQLVERLDFHESGQGVKQ